MKPILFIDFDGTLCHERYWRSLPQDQHQQIQELLFDGEKKMVNDWMRGKYTAEEINEFIANKLGMDYKNLWKDFVKDCENMKVSKNTLEKISSFRDRFTTILITGNMDSFSRFTVPSLNLKSYFNYISNSFYEGKYKTDDNGIIFLKYIEKFNAPIENSIVIDDSQNVCSIFENLGGEARLITDLRDIDYHLSTI